MGDDFIAMSLVFFAALRFALRIPGAGGGRVRNTLCEKMSEVSKVSSGTKIRRESIIVGPILEVPVE